MKNILPHFTGAALTGTILLLAAGLRAENPPPSAAALAESGVAADALLTQAMSELAKHDTITAKIQQKIDLVGHPLIGDGIYLQTSASTGALLRMELKVQVADQLCSLLHVSDGRDLWIEEQRCTVRTVQRMDLREVSRSLRPLKPRIESLAGGRLPLGGLPEWLHSLVVNFQFVHARQTELSGVPVQMLVGRWRKENLMEILPQQKEAIAAGEPADLSQLPAYLPQEVVLLLGRDDLFPYLIDYRRYANASNASNSTAPTPQSILRVQIYEVRLGGPVDLRQFVYQPGPVDVSDETKSATERLRSRGTRQLAARSQ